MPYKEKPIERVYWSIGELAFELDVATSAIRFWEGEGLLPKPKRFTKGAKPERRYNTNEALQVRKMKILLVFCGYTIFGARKVLERHILDDVLRLYGVI